MKQRKRWMAVLTVWTIALLFAAGFTSQASVSGSKMIQEKNSKYTTGAGAIAAAMESIPAEAVELTKAEAQKAQEAREQAEAEAKRKAEEEAARKAAEEAARAQIAAEDQKLLASLSTWRSVGASLASLVIGTGTPLVAYVTVDGNPVLSGSRMTIIAGVFSVLAVICYLLCYNLVRERVPVPHTV